MFSLLGTVFDFAIYIVQVCFLFVPYPELHQKALLEIERKEATHCLGEESYTLSDLRKLFEEQSFILIFKIFKKPKLFSRKIMVDLILRIGFEKL